jgi:hypothetical protein
MKKYAIDVTTTNLTPVRVRKYFRACHMKNVYEAVKIKTCIQMRGQMEFPREKLRLIKNGYPGCLTQKKFSAKVPSRMAIADEIYCHPS